MEYSPHFNDSLISLERLKCVIEVDENFGLNKIQSYQT